MRLAFVAVLFSACGELGIFPLKSPQAVTEAVGEESLRTLDAVATVDTALAAAEDATSTLNDVELLSTTLSKTLGGLTSLDGLFSTILPAPRRKASQESSDELPVELALVLNLVEKSYAKEFYVLSGDPKEIKTWLSLFDVDTTKAPIPGTSVTVKDSEVCQWEKRSYDTSNLCLSGSSGGVSNPYGSLYGYGTTATSSTSSAKDGYTVLALIGAEDSLGFPVDVTIQATIMGNTLIVQERFHLTSSWTPSTGRIEWFRMQGMGSLLQSFLGNRTEELTVSVENGKAYDPVQDQLADLPGASVTVLKDTTVFKSAEKGITKGIATYYRGAEEWRKLEWFKGDALFMVLWLGPQQIVRIEEGERILSRVETQILQNELAREGSAGSGVFQGVLTIDRRNLSRPTEAFDRWKKTLTLDEQIVYGNCPTACTILDWSGSAREEVEVQRVDPQGPVRMDRTLVAERRSVKGSSEAASSKSARASWGGTTPGDRKALRFFDEVGRWIREGGILSIRSSESSKSAEVRLATLEGKDGASGYKGTLRGPSGEDLDFTLTKAPAQGIVSRLEFQVKSRDLTGTLDYDGNGNATGSLTVRGETYAVKVSRESRSITITDAKGVSTSTSLESPATSKG